MLKIIGTPITQAYEFAKEKHGNQKYGKHPYIYHLIQVCEMTLKMELPEESQIIAYLHDTLEDTNTTYDELCENFGHRIATYVLFLTKDDNIDYFKYLKHVSSNEIVLKIKICDIMCNLQESILTGNQRLIDKYQKALFYLTTN